MRGNKKRVGCQSVVSLASPRRSPSIRRLQVFFGQQAPELRLRAQRIEIRIDFHNDGSVLPHRLLQPFERFAMPIQRGMDEGKLIGVRVTVRIRIRRVHQRGDKTNAPRRAHESFFRNSSRQGRPPIPAQVRSAWHSRSVKPLGKVPTRRALYSRTGADEKNLNLQTIADTGTRTRIGLTPIAEAPFGIEWSRISRGRSC
jgi:hypothetical protein